MIKNSKKGELTSQQLVTIIILIVSFAVIIIFFVLLNIKSSITDESCRNSIVMKGLPLAGSISTLKCQTKSICMNMGGNCENLKNAENIKVNNEPELNLEIIKLMKKCWDTTDQGKVQYGSDKYCGICYNIYFDDRIKGDDKLKEINQMELYTQVSASKVSEDETYLEYLYGYKDFNLFNNFMTGIELQVSANNKYPTQTPLSIIDYRYQKDTGIYWKDKGKSIIILKESSKLSELTCGDFPFLS